MTNQTKKITIENCLILFLQVKPVTDKMKFKIQTLYKLSEIFSICEKQMNFYNDNIENIVKEHGEKDANGDFVYLDEEKTRVKIALENKAQCEKEIGEMLDIEVDVKPSLFLTLNDLQDLEFDFSIFEMLKPFIKE